MLKGKCYVNRAVCEQKLVLVNTFRKKTRTVWGPNKIHFSNLAGCLKMNNYHKFLAGILLKKNDSTQDE